MQMHVDLLTEKKTLLIFFRETDFLNISKLKINL